MYPAFWSTEFIRKYGIRSDLFVAVSSFVYACVGEFLLQFGNMETINKMKRKMLALGFTFGILLFFILYLLYILTLKKKGTAGDSLF